MSATYSSMDYLKRSSHISSNSAKVAYNTNGGMTQIVCAHIAFRGLEEAHANFIINNIPNAEVVGMDDLSGGYYENINPKVKFYQKNLVDGDCDVIFEIHKPDYVYHLAAIASVPKTIKEPIIKNKHQCQFCQITCPMEVGKCQLFNLQIEVI